MTEETWFLCRSASLKILSLISCNEVSNKGFTDLVTNTPLLQDLSLELCPKIGGRNVYESTGKACPKLKRFSLRRECFRFSLNYPRRVAEALGIAARCEASASSAATSPMTSWLPSLTGALAWRSYACVIAIKSLLMMLCELSVLGSRH